MKYRLTKDVSPPISGITAADLGVGEMGEVLSGAYKGHIVICMGHIVICMGDDPYSRLVSLSDPKCIWANPRDVDIPVRRLVSGESVTLTVI